MIAGTRQNWPLCRVPKKTLGKGSVTVTWHRDGDFSLPSTQWHSTNSLSSARQKVLGKETAADVQFAERSLPSVTLGKAFAECKIAFAECLRHTAKELCPVVVVGELRFSRTMREDGVFQVPLFFTAFFLNKVLAAIKGNF
jgi:hypothetical protein